MKIALLLSAAAVLLPVAVSAQDASAESQTTILVTGFADGYAARDTVTATRTQTPLIDTPQTVNVVTRERIEDQAYRSIADVLRYVPGTTVAQGEGNRDQISLRGQNTSSDFFLDGVRDDVQYYRNLYNIERVEILKGPYALIFGRGGGGGIVNRVQKSPSNDGLFGNLSAGVNSFGAWDVAADLNLPVGGNGALRMNAFYEQLASHRDFYDGERYAINPYLAYDLGSGWSAGLSYEYVHDDRVTDRGVPSVTCTQPCSPAPLEGFRDTFFGVPGVNRAGLDAHIVKARIDGELAEGLDWSTSLLYGSYDKFYTNVYPNGAATSPIGTFAIAAYSDPTQRENILAQSNLVWEADLGGLANTVLLGVEYSDQNTRNSRSTGTLSASSLNLANLVYPSVSFTTLARDTHSQLRVFSAYAQDQIGIGEHLEVVLGLRYDRFDIEGTDFIPAVDRAFGRVDEELSPRIGLIVKPQPDMSLYASYSESFLPRSGDQFSSLTTTQENLAPERFTNYEVGAKWDIAGDLSATLALFSLQRTNATTPDPANPAATINVGETRTKGAELALVGRVTETWQVSAAYTWQDGALRGNKSVVLGQVPEHQLAFWNRVGLTSQWGIGLGVVHQSSQYAAIRSSANTTVVPGFTRVDAAVYFAPTDKLQLQLNIENLFDENYFSDAHNNNNITPGAPINARLTARLAY